jgi:DNA mismatch endonuclease (patch repair protein)
VPGTRRKVDIVFGPARIALFVDGCFWHGCPDHGRRRHNVNGWYWGPKIERNVARDQDTNERLEECGWRVIRVWEHEDMEAAAEQILKEVRIRRFPA